MSTRVAAVAAAVVGLMVTMFGVALTGGGDAGVRVEAATASMHGPSGAGPQWRRRGSMMPGSGMMSDAAVRSEYGFLAEMVAHHREAVVTAKELERSDRAEMRAFGESVVSTQSAQIRQMRSWLAEWYPDRSGRVAYQPMMRDLTGLTGDQLDRTFLQDMIGHHMAAVMMSHQLLMRGLAEHRDVASLARTIGSEQHAEILQMRRWLWQWFGTSTFTGGWGMTVSGRAAPR